MPSNNKMRFHMGSAVKLVNLQSKKGRQLNGRTGLIMSDEVTAQGRCCVRLNRKESSDEESSPPSDAKIKPIDMNIKPMNLVPVCNQCRNDSKKLLACAGCKQVHYCSKECQREHWKEHKPICPGRLATSKKKGETDEEIQAETNGKWNKSMDDASWTKHLSLKQRKVLRKFHISMDCTTAWPVTGAETTAMLESTPPSFLMMHPNMKFHVSMADLPGDFAISYTNAQNLNARAVDLHGIEGKNTPTGRKIVMIRETVPKVSKNASEPAEELVKAYSKNVPMHRPTILQYGIVAKDILWTKLDYEDFRSFYETQTSPFFNWPKVECVGVCPGTGEVVPFSSTRKHYLVACVVGGSVIQNDGSFNMLTRIMPRILTKEGLRRMVGDKGSEQRVIGHAIPMFDKPSSRKGSPMDLDDVLELLMLHKMPPGRPFASAAYSEFHAQGLYKQFERMIDEEKLRHTEGLYEKNMGQGSLPIHFQMSY
mmetsp:Transcript_41574/g.100123  ORF Transcript_41574/g.100123 Transcript_41574/m.100123 type:complete len:481 (+) Transcript_41574:1-1443(+)